MKSTISTLSLSKFVIALLFLQSICNFGFAQSYTDLVGPVAGDPGPLGYYFFNGTDTVLIPGTYQSGDILSLPDGAIDLDAMEAAGFLLPLVIPEGVTLLGTYDPINHHEGTLIFSDNHRSHYSSSYHNPTKFPYMYFFIMYPGGTSSSPNHKTTIHGINLRGPNKTPTGYNIGSIINHDDLYSGGILLFDLQNWPEGTPFCTSCNGYGYEISNCEISCFSHAGIWVDYFTDEITIKNNYIHHIKANPTQGSGYGIWTRTNSAANYSANTDNITIQNCIFDDARNSLDGSTAEINTNYHDNSTTQFCGGVNRHNNFGIYYPHWGTNSGCYFYHALTDDPQYLYCTSQCESTEAGFGFNDCCFGNITVENSIFHLDGCSFPYPGRYSIQKQDNFPVLPNSPSAALWDGQSMSSLINPITGYTTPTNGAWDVTSIAPNNFFDAFSFLGGNYTNCFVSTNGFVKFGTSATDLSGLDGTDPYYFPDDPLNSNPRNIIALCWTDLVPTSTSRIECWYSSPILYIEWQDVCAGSTECVSGQIHLYGPSSSDAGRIDILIEDQNISAAQLRLMGIIGASGNGGTVPYKALKPDINDPCDNTPTDYYWMATDEHWIAMPPVTYKIDVNNNTFDLPPVNPGICELITTGSKQSNMRSGYARIADNYIESCVWENDIAIQYENNQCGYQPGVAVSAGCPQPPEFTLDLVDAATGDPLTTTTNRSITTGHERVQHIMPGDAFKVSMLHGNLGSGNLSYIIRRNPNSNPPSATGENTSGENDFFNDEEVIAPTSTNPAISDSYNYKDDVPAPLTGLYGIDVLAIDGDGPSGNENYYSSRWQHIPLIVADPAVDYALIFNIKDSYQEFHNFAVNNCTSGCSPVATGVYKQAELNGIAIWREDIAFGGDEWERVEKNVQTDFDLVNGNPIMDLIKTDGSQNVLSFSIYVDDAGAVETDKLKGLLVWIDDVYLKKSGYADNLIEDGDIERTPLTTDLPDLAPTESSSWFQENMKSFNCCGRALISNGNNQAPFYIDGEGIDVSRANPSSKAAISQSVRKSGSHSVVLMMPALSGATQPNCTGCSTYDDGAVNLNPGIVISACTYFDFRGLLSCGDYPDPATTDPNHDFDLATHISAGTIGGSSTRANVYYLTSSCTLTNNLTLDGCALSIAPGSSIVVADQYTLTIQNSSTLFACSDMWAGIVVEPGGTLIINEGSSIYDAENAVLADNSGNGTEPVVNIGTYNTDDVIFDHNLLSVFYYNGNDFSSSFIKNTQFLCTGGMINRDPHYGEFPNVQIGAENAQNVKIGELHSGNENIIKDANIGISGVYSSLNVINTKFDNIGRNAYEESYSGIVMMGTSDAPASLTAGANIISAHVYKNVFTNCSRGIFCYGDVFTELYRNEFNSCDGAISQWQNSSKETTIHRNYITNCISGIDFCELGSDVPGLVVDSNVITGELKGGYPAAKNGISLFNSLNVPLPMEFNGNEITDNAIGIYIMNADVGVSSKFSVNGNIINYTFDTYHAGEGNYRGIDMVNCEGAEIGNNTVEWLGNNTNPAGTNLFAEQVQGIRVVDLQSSTIHNNSVTTCGSGMFMDGTCSGTYFKCNNFVENYPGIDFADVTNLPAQGGTGDPALNTWDIDYANWGKIAGNNPAGFDYYYSGNTTNSNPEYPHPQYSLNRIQTGTPQYACGEGGGGEGLMASEDPDNKDKELERIVDNPDVLSGDYAEQAEYYVREYAYSTMQELPVLINSQTRVDFMNSTEENNIGKLKEVEGLAIAGEITEASTSNTLIVDTNEIEENKKIVNAILLTAALGNDTLSGSDSTTLEQISHLPAKTGGDAVYWARGRLRLIIEDESPAFRKQKPSQPNGKTENEHGLLFPYPATEFVAYEFNHDPNRRIHVTVTDILGRTLFTTVMHESILKFTVGDWAPGIYTLRSFEDGILKDDQKICVIR